ncbi:hypothetical protein L3Y34_005716 [Caenorhabditis briggsae]|uniref:Uncharacterized protein n=1 Tax=Caenorhabditis briggsae TaxID=6238 RepID=A0AAE9D7S2_CAEBR|nr:hypothetical protein L3Y34_005716 [Caenorhabditis briggsae]
MDLNRNAVLVDDDVTIQPKKLPILDSDDSEADYFSDEDSMNDAFMEENVWRNERMTRGRGDCGDVGGVKNYQKTSKKNQSKLLSPSASPPHAKFQWANAKYVALLGRRGNSIKQDDVIGIPDLDDDVDFEFYRNSGKGYVAERFSAGRDISRESQMSRVPASSPVDPIDILEKMRKMDLFEKELEEKFLSENPSLKEQLKTANEKICDLENEICKFQVREECEHWKNGYENLLESMSDSKGFG